MSTQSLPSGNITEQIYRKNLELLQERRRTEQLLYSVSEIVIAIDSNYNVDLLNHTAEKFLSVTEEEAIGKQIDQLIKIQTEEGLPIFASQYCFQGDPARASLENVVLTTPTGSYYVNVKTSIIQSKEDKLCVVTIVDITKEMQLDKTKDEFISITSHELRTPITIIKSYLWMLKSGRAGELSEKQSVYLDKAIRGSDRMLNLINDMLNVAHIEQGKITIKLEEINLGRFLTEFDEEFKIKTDEKGLWLKNEVASGTPNVYADKNKLREVFLNFLGNSAKYTHRGGITIKVYSLDTCFVKIEIVDTGQGIKPEDIDKLFSKFSRLDNSFTTVAESGGTGLGLYITKSLVEKMGGKVGVESEGVGKGSTFWFTLPAADPDAKICSLVHNDQQ